MASMNVSLLHTPSPSFRAKIISSQPRRIRGVYTRSSLNGRESKSLKSEVNKFGSTSQHNKGFQLFASVNSDNFPVKKSGFLEQVRDTLSKLGVPNGVLEFVFGWIEDQKYPQIPEAKGSLKQIRSRLMILFFHDLYFTHGPIIRCRLGPKSFIVVSDPSMVKHILKTNAKAYSKGILAEVLDFVMGKGLISADGELWRVRRRAIVPALHMKYLATMMNLFGQATNRLCQKLEASAMDGENVEMESMFSHVTLDIIGKAVFDYDFDSLRNDTGIVEAVYIVLRETEMRSIETIPSWAIPIWKDISPRHKKVSKALKLINDTLDNLILTCKRMVEEEGDQFNEDYVNDKDPSILRFLLASGNDVSRKQLRDDLMTLLIAGHETTASTLTWTFYLLSQNPSAMKKLQEEVDSVLGDRFPTIGDMKKLKYTTRVINESLRLYPHPPLLVRRALEDDMLGQYRIKRGTDVFISVWNLHHSPTLWENVEEFIPERWALDGPNPNETNENFRYMTFGGGPRKCIGDQFATYESVVALSMLVRRFEFKMAIDAPQVKMTTGGTIHTTEGLVMSVTKRLALTGET